MGKTSPTAEYVIEVIKMLEPDELDEVYEFITSKMNETRIIDIEPISKEPVFDSEENSISDHEELEQQPTINSDATVNLIKNLLEGNSLSSLLLSTDNPLLNLANSSQIGGLLETLLSSSGKSGLSFLAKILPKKVIKSLPQIVNLFQNQSREENLVQAIVPFIPVAKQAQITRMSGLVKMVKIFQLLR